MTVQAYVFIDTKNSGPMRIVTEIRNVPGVVRADALFGVPDIIALVEGDDIAGMDGVIDTIAELDGVLDPESKVVRWVQDPDPARLLHPGGPARPGPGTDFRSVGLGAARRVPSDVRPVGRSPQAASSSRRKRAWAARRTAWLARP